MKGRSTGTTSSSASTDKKKTTLKQGAKFDGEKLRVDLVPVEAIYASARAFTYGAKKYEDHNWEKGISWHRVYGALLRHIFSWWLRRGPDPESGLCHLDHAHACLAMLSHYRKHPRYKRFDNRPK